MMSDDLLPQTANTAPQAHSRRDRSGISAILAALIGLLALIVSGYTAYIQRQQVRAQVWPYLLVGYADPERAMIVLDKGVGPAIVRSVEVLVDGKHYARWSEVLAALGIDNPDDHEHSTISGNVLSSGERLSMLSIPDEARYKAFVAQSTHRLATHICYCSTLGECWSNVRGESRDRPAVQAVDRCPALAADEAFKD
jgi:hypothetical protein